MNIRLSAAIAALAIAPAMSANAVVLINKSPILSGLSTGQTMIDDFNTNVPRPILGNFALVTGTTGSWADPGHVDGTQYLVVPGTGSTGSALYSVGSFLHFAGGGNTLVTFSADIGSADTYNSIDFGTVTGGVFSSLYTITGAMLVGSGLSGDQTSPFTNYHLSVIGLDTLPGPVNAVRVNSNGVAFETDNWGGSVGNTVGGVPEPASWALIVAGFGMTGFAMRRRTKTVLA